MKLNLISTCVISEGCNVKFREAGKSGDPDLIKNAHEGSEYKEDPEIYQMGC